MITGESLSTYQRPFAQVRTREGSFLCLYWQKYPLAQFAVTQGVNFCGVHNEAQHIFCAFIISHQSRFVKSFLSPRKLSPNIDKNRLVCYNLRAGTLKPYGGEEVYTLEELITFVLSVEAGLAANLIWWLLCKWLDKGDRR